MRTQLNPAKSRARFAISDPAGTRVVVASQGEAQFYDVGPGSIVTGTGRMVDTKARMRDRDFSSDRPGRVFDRAAPAGRRGASAHHSTNGERSPHQRQALVFARRIVAQLERARRLNEFQGIVIVAAPAFLGLLHSVMHGPLRKMIVGQVRKDFAHRPEHILKAHVVKLLAERDW
jgi:protein required for attachment to host cells